MNNLWASWKTLIHGSRGDYRRIPPVAEDERGPNRHDFRIRQHGARTSVVSRLVVIVLCCVFAGLLLTVTLAASLCALWSPKADDTRNLGHYTTKSCDSVDGGFGCNGRISQYWGQYSPYFSLGSRISADIPKRCNVTFVQMLSRHGARDPTAGKSLIYRSLIKKIKSNVHRFRGDYEFLERYEYTLGSDQLTTFGEQQMVNSGLKFYNRYRDLTHRNVPFIRASGQKRVVASAWNFSQGYHKAHVANGSPSPDNYPYRIIVLSEAEGSNNSLSHGLCEQFESDTNSEIARGAQKSWQDIFVPNIAARLNSNLPGANLTKNEVISFMDLCPFTTVASNMGQISPFCSIFTEEEWHQYDYYQSLGKYYGYGNGNPLGPTQGVGFAQELIIRMTMNRLTDLLDSNGTLKVRPFGLIPRLYVDFSHDSKSYI